MSESIFEQTNFSLAEDISKLGAREKNAVRTILRGFFESQKTGKEQKPVKITITPYQPFKLVDFAKVMYEMGIDIASTLLREENAVMTTVTFLPKPYEGNNFIKGIISSKETTEHFIESFLDYEPSPAKSKPQK